MSTHVDTADEVQSIPDRGPARHDRAIQPPIDAFVTRNENDFEMRVERNTVVGGMCQQCAAGRQAVVHVVQGRERVGHVLERIDRECDVELARCMKVLTSGADQSEIKSPLPTEFQDGCLHIGEIIEF